MSAHRTVVDEAGVHVEFTDGELTGLRFRPREGAGADDVVAGIRRCLERAEAEHLDSREGTAPEPPDADRDAVMAFVAAQLDRARDVPLPEPPVWLPTQADGRDPSGRAHVSVTPRGVPILEVSEDLLADPREAAAAIVAAYRLAQERLAADALAYAARFDRDTGSDDVSWSELAFTVRQLRGQV